MAGNDERNQPFLSRRALIAGAVSLPLAAALPLAGVAATPVDLGDASAIRQRAAAFLALLAPEERSRTLFAHGDATWKRWNYFGVGGFVKPGFRLEEMNAEQKLAAWELAGAVLSERGLAKLRDVMSLQEVLRERGDGVETRSGERYSFALFNLPDAAGLWAFRIEGHHLSLSFTIDRDRLVGVTPSSFSSNPNRVEGGSRQGLVTLRGEDAAARTLAGDLAGSAGARAFFRDAPYRNILTTAGREASLDAFEGLALAEFSAGQNDLATETLTAFALEHLRAPFAENLGRVIFADREATHFAVSGSPKPAEPIYYRFHGKRFLVEFASVDRAAQHLHTIFHLL
jgi:hypothetical protein